MLDHKYIHPICPKSNHNHSDIHATLHFCLFQESQYTRHSPLPAKFRRYHYHYYISHTMLQGKTGRLLMYTTSSISSFQQIYLSFPDVIMHGTTYYSSFAVDFSLTQRTEQALNLSPNQSFLTQSFRIVMIYTLVPSSASDDQ